MLLIKEIFYSLQGEGGKVGKPTIFIRFAGCNLWSGLEKDKQKSVCYFCDTDFNNGIKYTIEKLVEVIIKLIPVNIINPYIVFTGGEPTLQLTNERLKTIKKLLESFDYIPVFGLETNGEKDIEYEDNIWITVSPKTKNFKIKNYNELKLLYPLNSVKPYEILTEVDNLYLQPIDNLNYKDNLKATIEYCLLNPKWSLSLQQHKIIGVD